MAKKNPNPDPLAEELGRRGGKARWKGTTKAQRKAASALALGYRWAGKPPVVCPVCGAEVRSQRALWEHRTSAHPGARKPRESKGLGKRAV
jgi:hypothetical protein